MSDQSNNYVDPAEEAINELRQLLRDSYADAMLLKQDVPGELFPAAYRLTETIREMRQQIQELQQLVSETTVTDIKLTTNLFEPTLLNSSESSASIC